jgi:acyl-CoA:6-aminopenicillanic acid acyl transferase
MTSGHECLSRRALTVLGLVGLLLCVSCGPARDVSVQNTPAPAVVVEVEGVLRLEGTPAEIGRRHGELAKDRILLMVKEYVGHAMVDGRLNDTTQKRISAMKGSLPSWYLDELNACADAVGLDRDVLLYAQCEGDIDSLPGCTSYVAFGEATHDGHVEMGRNLDYWGLESTEECVTVLAVLPEAKGHYAFVSVGWTGILGGWTIYNEKGLYISNVLLWGFPETNPKGIPTLILQRMIAEQAATVDEAIAMIKRSPRMRAQAMVIGHAGDPQKGIKPSAAVVEYDAKKVVVSRPADGFVYHTSVGTAEPDLRARVKADKADPYDAIKAFGNGITLHSVAIDPASDTMWVAHGTRPGAHRGEYVPYRISELLKRRSVAGE